jgi:hypothetical protein
MITPSQHDSFSKSNQPLSTEINGATIAVYPDDSGAQIGLFQERFCMPTISHRAIHNRHWPLRNKPKTDFFL